MKWTTSTPLLRPLSDAERTRWAQHKQRRPSSPPLFVRLAGAELSLLQNLARKESEELGYAWPSRARLAEEQGCTVDTIDRKIKLLVEAGLISVTRGGGTRSSTNRYRVLVPCEIRHCDRKWMERHACPSCKHDQESTRAHN